MPEPCKHEYTEAQNYGQQRDNVECPKCGQFWIRADRAAGSGGNKPQEISVDVMAREAITNFYRICPEVEEMLMNRHIWLVEQVAIAIRGAFSAVRREYDTSDLTIAIQERIEFKDQRDALIAARADEQIKTKRRMTAAYGEGYNVACIQAGRVDLGGLPQTEEEVAITEQSETQLVESSGDT